MRWRDSDDNNKITILLSNFKPPQLRWQRSIFSSPRQRPGQSTPRFVSVTLYPTWSRTFANTQNTKKTQTSDKIVQAFMNQGKRNKTYTPTEMPIPSPRLPSIPLSGSPVDPVMPHVLMNNFPRKFVFVRFARERGEASHESVQCARKH